MVKNLILKYFNLAPDLIVVDIAMPGISGIEAVEKIIAKDPNVKSLFLSMYDAEEYVYKVFKIGGLGLVNKNILNEELLLAIDKVYEGDKYFGAKWTEESLEQLLNDYEASHKENKLDETKLNFREEQVLKWIVEGIKSKQIADKLNLSKKSIDYYRASLLRKLSFKTQAELIKFGIDYFNAKNKNLI